ncbi:hypothetical protein H4R21_002326 [Coemansia helicoidea]|uniref:Uncharacterized protein n=1 Tax=Coemansia helicoidea TaxID=1286919 RepID=A0ACC1L8M5_9FUNG|nr:hypothetical protein H4R21_002326 [Coemansia helicoidea]
MDGASAAVGVAAAVLLYCCARLLLGDCRVALVAAPASSLDGKSVRALVEAHCPSLADPKKARLVPTPYLVGGVLQTVYCAYGALRRDKQSDIRYEREALAMSDGGTVSLDWYPGQCGDAASEQPIAVLVPGVGGSAYEYHIRALARHLAARTRAGVRVVVANHRGSGRTPLTSARLYNAYDTRDVADVLGHVARRFPRAPMVGVGFSMGGNLLTRYMGDAGDRALLAAAAVISCPFDVELAGRAMDRPGVLSDWLFHGQVVASLKRVLVRNREVLAAAGSGLDFDAIMRATRLSEIDSLVTSKTYGFGSCWEYYRAASSGPWVASIRRPFLAINARNDPMAPAAGIPTAAFAANPHTAAALLRHGGHIGFYAGLPPRIWFLQPVAEFVDAALASAR